MAKKLRPRKHGRAPRELLDDAGVLKRNNDAVVSFDKAFRAKLPSDEKTGQNPVSSGNYTQVEGDQFHDQEYPIADGRYRVQGSDWIFTFEGGGFVEAELAQPPSFGGDNVIAVTA